MLDLRNSPRIPRHFGDYKTSGNLVNALLIQVFDKLCDEHIADGYGLGWEERDAIAIDAITWRTGGGSDE